MMNKTSVQLSEELKQAQADFIAARDKVVQLKQAVSKAVYQERRAEPISQGSKSYE